MLIALRSTPDNARGPRYAEQALSAIHQANTARQSITFQYAYHNNSVGLFCRFPTALKTTVLRQFHAAYPDCKLARLPDHALDPPGDHRTWTAELQLRSDFFPIRTHPQFEDRLEYNTADPLTGILATLTESSPAGCRSMIELHVRPAAGWKRWYARHVLDRLNRPFLVRHPFLSEVYGNAASSRWLWPWALGLGLFTASRDGRRKSDTANSQHHDRETALEAAEEKIGRHLFSVRIRLIVSAPAGSRHVARRRIDEMAGGFGQFTSPKLSTFKRSRVRRRRRTPGKRLDRGGFLLCDEELATLWHPPTQTVRAETMQSCTWREMEPPVQIASGRGESEDGAVLGRLKFRSKNEAFGIRLDDRRRHVAVVGKTGMGKSTLLERLVASDVTAGRGVGLIDPHGDLAEKVIDLVPPRRTNDVVLFDAGDREFPVAFNPLSCPDPHQRPLVTSGVVSAFKKIYGDSWGPRLEHILRNTLFTLVSVPGTSLLSVLRLLSDPHYRKTIVSHVDDPVVRSFWQDEFAAWNDRYRNEAVAPIQNKIGQFLASPILRAITGQAKSTIDLRRAMDSGQVLIVNLSKGRIGEDASSLLGSLLVTSIQQAAMGRAEIAENDRRDFFLYVDEFQNFATESFATILSEARKYRLSLTIANQYLAQMDEATLHAVFGNVGSLISFQVGPSDAELLAGQLAGDVTEQDLIGLPRFTAYVRLLIEGTPSRPFSMETLPPTSPRRGADRSQKVRNHSRHRYSVTAKG